MPSQIGLFGNEETDRLTIAAASDRYDVNIVPDFSELFASIKD